METDSNKILSLALFTDGLKEDADLFQALSNPVRLRILREAYLSSKTIPELSTLLDIPVTTIEFHVRILEKANLITIRYLPGKKGDVRVLFANYSNIHLALLPNVDTTPARLSFQFSQGVGEYVDFHCSGEHGIATSTMGYRNEDADFLANRREAGLLWANDGYVVYAFPNGFAKEHKVNEITFSFEICSETSGYRNDWKSDLTFMVNGVELLTWCSPGDFGGRRGKLNPSWWSLIGTQYGVLKQISIGKDGVSLDGLLLNRDVTLDSLHLESDNKILFKVANKPSAVHVGGFNLFGKTFGDYPTDIVLTADCQ